MRLEYRSFLEELSSLLMVYRVGITWCDAAYLIDRECSSMIDLQFVLSGAGYIEIEGETFRVEKNSVFLLPAGSSYVCWADAKDPFDKIFLCAKGELCQSLLEAFSLNAPRVYEEGGAWRGLFEDLVQIYRSTEPVQQVYSRLQGKFVEILAAISNRTSALCHSEEARRLKAYLDENTNKIVTTEELAKSIFRSPDYCLKLFAREFHVTPYRYQINQKMEIARFLLSTTKMPVSEVASRLGYDDGHYFSNLFLAKCGVRPLQYRKQKSDT